MRKIYREDQDMKIRIIRGSTSFSFLVAYPIAQKEQKYCKLLMQKEGNNDHLIW